MVVNMLSFDRSKVFQHKCYCLESLKTKRVRKTTVHESRNLQESRRLQEAENHKIMKSPGNQEIQEVHRVRKSARVKEDCQVSRIQNLKSLEDWQTTRVKNQEDNS
jgi:hypothetical protein